MGNALVALPDMIPELAPSQEEADAYITDPVRTIITPDGWKLNCSPLGYHELYNLKRDPGETRNVVRENAVRDLVQDLFRRILAWQERVGDPIDLSQCRLP
jgi:arylsulfatase A-like enzyme